jgi:hypothetical protein
LIERIAARNKEVVIAELIKTITVDESNYKIEIYYTHKLAVSEPYHALLYVKVASDESDAPDAPHSVWELLPGPTTASTMEQCLQNAIDDVGQHSAL